VIAIAAARHSKIYGGRFNTYLKYVLDICRRSNHRGAVEAAMRQVP
jgi:hypothetical protein